MTRLSIISILAGLLCVQTLLADDFVPAPDTQKEGEHPPTPAEALAKITVPEGFKVDLIAAEPDVRQPLDMKFDERGRLWVTESYSYDGYKFAEGVDDRILIFEDTDADGTFDSRKVFWDKANRLTSLEFGPGGIFVLNAAELQFVPDRNRDDVPDGPAVTLLDGFDTENVGHNIVSGLIWGPDGWLYGRHGIKATSRPGPPHVPPRERVQINCGIWRYHPVSHDVEVVTTGTTNPWGMDFNEAGELFFTNNVIGHLWHIIPGAHFQRMYGDDFNPHYYGLPDQHADHYHWDHSQNWTDSRSASGTHDELGGGHSHCGGMIYLGDNWPDEYRGRMMMCNTHGRRINQDALVREGSGYVCKHEPDFFFANQPWFRGVSLLYGPDGAVYISDWCDFGECHDHDGIHRTSGRIYRLSYQKPNPVPADLDLRKAPLAELIKLHTHKNNWYVRTARRILLERKQTGEDIYQIEQALIRLMVQATDPRVALRSVWTLATLGTIQKETIAFLLQHPNESFRVWGLRLLVEYAENPQDWFEPLIQLAIEDESGLVRLHLASISQRLPEDLRWSILESLAVNEQDRDDHNIPLMVWYGIEPLVPKRPQTAVSLIERTQFTKLQRFLARRITSDIDQSLAPVNKLVTVLGKHQSSPRGLEILRGMTDALKGWNRAPEPESWAAVSPKLLEHEEQEVRELAQELALVFGDGRAMDDLFEVAQDADQTPATRQRAIRLLVQLKADGVKPLLIRWVSDRAVAPAAIEGLSQYDDIQGAKTIISRYMGYRSEHPDTMLATLASRPSFASLLLDAVESGKIPREDISASLARQIENLGDETLTRKLLEIWGTLRKTPEAKLAEIESWKEKLTKENLAAANLSQGRELFNKTCANCHRLFGEGKKTAPDLTGSNRDNLDYLLMNIIDPSAVVPQTFKVSVVVMDDGRVLTGVLGRDDGKTVELQTVKEKMTLLKSEIEETKSSSLSLMPDGLIEKMSEQEVRDLIAWLQLKRPPAVTTSRE